MEKFFSDSTLGDWPRFQPSLYVCLLPTNKLISSSPLHCSDCCCHSKSRNSEVKASLPGWDRRIVKLYCHREMLLPKATMEPRSERREGGALSSLSLSSLPRPYFVAIYSGWLHPPPPPAPIHSNSVFLIYCSHARPDDSKDERTWQRLPPPSLRQDLAGYSFTMRAKPQRKFTIQTC